MTAPAEPEKSNKMGSTLMGTAIKFAARKIAAAPDVPVEQEPGTDPAPKRRPSVAVAAVSTASAVAVFAVDHWISMVVQAAFGIAAIAFAIHPIKFIPPDTARYIIGGIGVLCLPFVPDGIAGGVKTLAPAVKTVVDVVKVFLPTKGDK